MSTTLPGKLIYQLWSWTWFCKRFGPLVMNSINLSDRQTFHDCFWLFKIVSWQFLSVLIPFFYQNTHLKSSETVKIFHVTLMKMIMQMFMNDRWTPRKSGRHALWNKHSRSLFSIDRSTVTKQLKFKNLSWRSENLIWPNKILTGRLHFKYRGYTGGRSNANNFVLNQLIV